LVRTFNKLNGRVEREDPGVHTNYKKREGYCGKESSREGKKSSELGCEANHVFVIK